MVWYIAFICLLISIFTIGIYFIQKRFEGEPLNPVRTHGALVPVLPVSRSSRIQRSRIQRNVSERRAAENEEETSESNLRERTGKIGTKKQAKLEAKAEKKALRERELKLREEKKIQQELEEKEKKLKEEQEELEEKEKELELQRIEEEWKRQEEEEYMKLKEAFAVEDQGYEEDSDEDDNLLQIFIDHIKTKKVVMIEDLAMEFKMKSQVIIDRIELFLSDGILTGVIDDRGKFIYITRDELRAAADFIRKRGRVTIQELVENSNNIITLNQC